MKGVEGICRKRGRPTLWQSPESQKSGRLRRRALKTRLAITFRGAQGFDSTPGAADDEDSGKNDKECGCKKTNWWYTLSAGA
jgi:hypothetical protein